jgi:phosphohistidine phosphatase
MINERMKKLLLVRHAKASHDTSYSDFERPLKHSGISDATFMAERLKSESIIPQLLVASSSIRTEATADILTQHLSLPKATLNKRIYDGGQNDILKIISDFKDQYDFISLVGHNPDIAQLVYYFTEEMRDVSPGTAILVTFNVDQWKLLSRNTGTLTWFGSPKDH